MSFSDRQTLSTGSGATLNLYVEPASAAPRGVIQINHGLAEHAARYAAFAKFLSAHGFHVYAHDHRGHGFTRAPDAPPGRFAAPDTTKGRFAGKDGVEKLIADVDAVHDLIAQKHPGLPVIVFGHSMGGMIALNYVLRHSGRIHAASVWNSNFQSGLPALAARAILGLERFRLGSDVPSRLLPKLTFEAWGKAVPGHRTLFDWLSRDPAEVDAYIADPLCGWNASVSLWIDLFRLAGNGADDAQFAGIRRTLPFYLVGGESDPATDGGKSMRQLASRMKTMGFSDVTTTIWPQTRHESLNEINRDQIMADFMGWLERVCPAGSGPSHPA